MAGKIILHKSYSRDFTLVLEQSWINFFKRDFSALYGLENPYEPYAVLYVTDENLEIWEHGKAIRFLQDWLLEKNKRGTDFMAQSVKEYGDIVRTLEGYWERGGTNDASVISEYLKASEKAFALFCFWYYACIDDRTPEDVQELVRALRENDEYFARNDTYIKDCIVALGGKRELANLILLSEFPNIPDEATLRARTKGIVVIDGGKVFSSTLAEFAANHPEYVFEDLQLTVEDTTELKGPVAYKGMATGVVKVVKNVRSMEKVQEGDILVSPMTSPDFLPAMKKAAAIVTDEGGIMCHAAIVARELKKTCVIGTKFATQVLHDGDLVEVDAEKGIVTILERT